MQIKSNIELGPEVMEEIENYMSDILGCGVREEAHHYEEDWGDHFTLYNDNGEIVTSSSGQSGENVSDNAVYMFTVNISHDFGKDLELEVEE